MLKGGKRSGWELPESRVVRKDSNGFDDIDDYWGESSEEENSLGVGLSFVREEVNKNEKENEKETESESEKKIVVKEKEEVQVLDKRSKNDKRNCFQDTFDFGFGLDVSTRTQVKSLVENYVSKSKAQARANDKDVEKVNDIDIEKVKNNDIEREREREKDESTVIFDIDPEIVSVSFDKDQDQSNNANNNNSINNRNENEIVDKLGKHYVDDEYFDDDDDDGGGGDVYDSPHKRRTNYEIEMGKEKRQKHHHHHVEDNKILGGRKRNVQRVVAKTDDFGESLRPIINDNSLGKKVCPLRKKAELEKMSQRLDETSKQHAVDMAPGFKHPGFRTCVIYLGRKGFLESHTHLLGNRFQVMYVVSGKVHVQLDETDFYVSRGEHFFVPPNEKCDLFNETNSKCKILLTSFDPFFE